MNDDYINTARATSILGITSQTLRVWAEAGKIRFIRTPSNHRRYNREDVFRLGGVNTPVVNQEKVIYCRVSTKKQMDDLDRQAEFLQSRYPDHVLVTDIGSGINWKRKGLKEILERALSGELTEVVVAHRDRLCRFAFELIEFILEQSGVSLLVHNEDTDKSSSSELAEDLLSIIHIYSYREMGKRRYTRKKNKDIPDGGSESDTEKVDGDGAVCIQQSVECS